MRNRIKKNGWRRFADNWSVIVVCCFLFFAACFFCIRKGDVYLTVHDYLDSHLAWTKMVLDNNAFFDSAAILPFLGGIAKGGLLSCFKLYSWLFVIFSPLTAIEIGWIIKIIISVVSFFLLSTELKGSRNTYVLCGLLYGILPTYPPSAFSFASLPLLAYVLLLLYRKKKKGYILFFFLYPVLSDFSIFGLFICGYLLVAFIVISFFEKKINWLWMTALFAMIAGYILTEYSLFNSMLFSRVETIRESFVFGELDFSGGLREAAEVFVNGYYHCGSLHKYFVMPVTIFCLIWENVKHIQKKRPGGIRLIAKNGLFLWICFNCLIYGLNDWTVFRKFVSIVLPPLKGFSFARTIWFNPFLWYFLFCLILSDMRRTTVRYAMIVISAIIICVMPETYNSIRKNVGSVAVELINRENKRLTYQEYFSEKLFDKVKKEIDYRGEWTVAYGMHPAVIEYNGFATLDGYLSSYPMEYKNRFRKIIAPELDRDEQKRLYYDEWGGRAYIFSSQIGYGEERNMERESAPLYIDPDALKELGGRYVLSRVRIENNRELGLTDKGVFTDDSSPYSIYVYELDQ